MRKTIIVLSVLLIVLLLASCAPAVASSNVQMKSGVPSIVNLPKVAVDDDKMPVIKGVVPMNYCVYIFYVNTDGKLVSLPFCPDYSSKND